MNNTEYFKEFLLALKAVRQLSLTEFSEELSISRSTLQSILKTGQTTLDTACRISNHVGIPLSAMLTESLPVDNLRTVYGLLSDLTWFHNLAYEDQQIVANSILKILEVLKNAPNAE